MQTVDIAKGMIEIPAGDFLMGSELYHEEMPVHRVSVGAFSMDATPVTQEDYKALTGANPSAFPSDKKRPVEKVTWFDAVLYCNARSLRDGLEPVYRYSGVKKPEPYPWVEELKDLEIDYSRKGYRLPTEAEWEYACRAGTTAAHYWGEEIDNEYAWWFKSSRDISHAVGQKKPNAWGLYDMIGNVWEWCNDWFGEEYYGKSPEKNPKGPDSGECRVLRGGSWLSLENYQRSGSRYRLNPRFHGNSFGFRCVMPRL